MSCIVAHDEYDVTCSTGICADRPCDINSGNGSRRYSPASGNPSVAAIAQTSCYVTHTNGLILGEANRRINCCHFSCSATAVIPKAINVDAVCRRRRLDFETDRRAFVYANVRSKSLNTGISNPAHIPLALQISGQGILSDDGILSVESTRNAPAENPRRNKKKDSDCFRGHAFRIMTERMFALQQLVLGPRQKNAVFLGNNEKWSRYSDAQRVGPSHLHSDSIGAPAVPGGAERGTIHCRF